MDEMAPDCATRHQLYEKRVRILLCYASSMAASGQLSTQA
jgi:hypothetical protein